MFYTYIFVDFITSVKLVVGYTTERSTANFIPGVSTNVWSRARIVESLLFQYRGSRIDGSKMFVGRYISVSFISIHLYLWFLLPPRTLRRVFSWTDISVFFVSLIPCVFLQSIYQPTNTINEIQRVTSVKILHVSLEGLGMSPRCIFFILVDMLKVPPFSEKRKSFVLSIIIFQLSFESLMI